MWKCKNCGEIIEDSFSACWSCGATDEGYVIEGFQPIEEGEDDTLKERILTSSSVMLSTTSLLLAYPNLKILGLVCSQAVAGKDLFVRTLGGMTHLVGTTYESYMKYVEEAREEVVNNIIRQAIKSDANAIMGIKIEYHSIGNGGVMVSALGTAVIV